MVKKVSTTGNKFADKLQIDFMKFKDSWDYPNSMTLVEFDRVKKKRTPLKDKDGNKVERAPADQLVIKITFRDSDFYKDGYSGPKPLPEERLYECNSSEIDVKNIAIEELSRHIRNLENFFYEGYPEKERLKINHRVKLNFTDEDYSMFKRFFESQCVNLINYVLVALETKELDYTTAKKTLGPLLDHFTMTS